MSDQGTLLTIVDREIYHWGAGSRSAVKLDPIERCLNSRKSTKGQIVKGCDAQSGPNGTPGPEQPRDDHTEHRDLAWRPRNEMVDCAYNRLEHTVQLLPDAQIGWLAFESAAEIYETRKGALHQNDVCALWIRTRDGLETLTLSPGIEMISAAYEASVASGYTITHGTFAAEIYEMMHGASDKQNWQGQATTNDDGDIVMPRPDALMLTLAIGMARHEHKRREQEFVQKWQKKRAIFIDK